MAKGQLMKQSVTGLPSWAKGVIAVVAVGGVAVIGYLVYKKIKSIGEQKSAISENKAAANEAQELAKAGVKPTLTSTQLNNIVNGIKQAWLDYNPVTRSHVRPFYAELSKVKNDLDMLNLITAYGIQKIDFPWNKVTHNDYEGNLSSSVKNFLNKEEVTAANNLLAKKAIKNRF